MKKNIGREKINIEEFKIKNKDLALLFNNMPYYVKDSSSFEKVGKKTYILKKDYKTNYVYIFIDGKMKIENQFSNGNIYSFAYMLKGSVIGAMEVLINKKIACSVVTVEDSLVYKIHVNAFLKWFNEDLFFSKYIALMISKYSYNTAYYNGYPLLNSTLDSTISYILKQSSNILKQNPNAKNFNIKDSREDMSNEIGISLRSLYRNLKKLKEEGYLDIENKTVKLTFYQYKMLKQRFENQKNTR
ncbi:Crp/Fnr family transcriptional regulator [Peptostreptococcaceae bacterium AGR-M142]